MSAPAHCVLVLGGYGFFGQRICAELARNPALSVLIGGRGQSKALQLSRALQLPDDRALQINALDDQLAGKLKSLVYQFDVQVDWPLLGRVIRYRGTLDSRGAR